jgi:hypothetical protein
MLVPLLLPEPAAWYKSLNLKKQTQRLNEQVEETKNDIGEHAW